MRLTILQFYFTMKSTLQHFAFITILLLLFSITEQCVYLQSGVTTFTKSNTNFEEFQFQFTPNFVAPNNRPIQAVASATNLQINWNSNQIDFLITAQHNPNTNSVIIVLFIPSVNSWNSIQISYFISGRSQFYLGTFAANVYIDSMIANGQSFNKDIPILGWTPSNSNAKGIVQYSGIRSRNNPVTVTTNSLTINPSSGILTMSIRISSSTARVHFLLISYIVFVENPVTHTSFNYLGTIPPSNYVFIGIQSINGLASTYQGHNFFTQNINNGLICIGALCTNQQCLTSQQCGGFGGIVSGIYCFRCRQGQVIINGRCTTQTQNCRPNYIWDGVRCICPNNFIEINSNCYQSCGTNGYFFNGNCVCLDGFVWNNGQCVRTIQCPINSSPNSQGSCICNNGFIPLNSQCVRACPTNQAINTINNACIQCNTLGHIIQNFICKCTSSYFLTASGCQTCPANSQYNPQTLTCNCNNGFQSQNGQCFRACNPPQLLVSGICICPPGQGINPLTNLCISCQSAVSFVQNNICYCRSPNFMTTLGCSNCPSNSEYDPNLNNCRCIAGFQLNINLQCVSRCTGGQIWNGNNCACPNGQGINQITNNCIPCTSAGHILQNSICRCASTYIPTANGCIACPANSIYNSVSQRCICSQGYYSDNNNCFPCHSSCLTCTGPSNSQCTSCLNNISPNNGFCGLVNCPAGQYRSSSNVCLNCLSNCISCADGTNCLTCQDGYTRTVVGSVVSCVLNTPPVGSLKLTKRSYVVGNRVVYQGITMNMMPAAILQSNCNICNNLLLVSTSISVTQKVQYIINSQYWFLIQFSFPNAGIIPTFDFKVQINPVYANFFTAQDMVVNVFGSISQQSTYSNAPPAAASLVATMTFGTQSADSSQSSQINSSGGSSRQDIINQIFG